MAMAKILFLTTAHQYNDDRIFYHQAKSLQEEGHSVKISSLSSYFTGKIEDIEIESYDILKKSTAEKKQIFHKIIQQFQPDCIIASEPLAVIAAKNYSKKNKYKLIYDVTEWYPSRRMVLDFSVFARPFQWIKFFLIQLYAGLVSDSFIFGEPAKQFPLANLFPFKKKLLLPYFPDKKFIHQQINRLDKDRINLCYTGTFSEEKGIGNFFNAVDKLKSKKPELNVSILLIGNSKKEEDAEYFSSLVKKYRFENLEIRPHVSFDQFTKNFADADILFDLREKNFENDRCLPIKIFYYAAAGKPVIYTDLDATRNFVDVPRFGFLVNPSDAEYISDIIIKYVENPELYEEHARNAVELYEEKYSWNSVRNSFVKFVENSLQ